MNPSFPDWNIGTELLPPVFTHKNKTLGWDGELMELMWENGQVVLHAQTHHHNPKPGPDDDSRQHVDNQSAIRSGGSVFTCGENPVTDLIQDTETVSWIDDPFDKEFSSNFLPEFRIDDQPVGGKHMDHRCSSNLAASNPSLPPRFYAFDHRSSKNGSSVPDDEPVKQADYFRAAGNRTMRGEVGEHSVKTVASSHCGSNQVMTEAADSSRVSSSGIGDRGLSGAAVVKDHVGKNTSFSDRIQTETIETVITSSSTGGSQSSFGRTSKQCRGTSSHKRKTRDAEDSECQSKDAEQESAPSKKPGLKSRKSARVAEVHNQSERRRRDRINEKMRILQELLPHSNKTDKASMLDEAIEYMKSLQLQLQMMWMRANGMAAPFMFPSVQHCMSPLGMGIAPLPPLTHNPMQFSRLPLQVDHHHQSTMTNQAAAAVSVCQTNNMFNKIQLQNLQIPPQQFANYMQFHALRQSTSPQQINGFRFGPTQ